MPDYDYTFSTESYFITADDFDLAVTVPMEKGPIKGPVVGARLKAYPEKTFNFSPTAIAKLFLFVKQNSDTLQQYPGLEDGTAD
jgi:hypothetical protein